MRDNLPTADTTMTLVPRTDYDRVRYGIITPSGELFSCGYTEHNYLVHLLINRRILKFNGKTYNGCVHISNYKFDKIEYYRYYKSLGRISEANEFADAIQLTNKQMDKMFDYVLALGIKFDFGDLELR